MQKTLCLVICLLLLAAPLTGFGAGDAQAGRTLLELRGRYTDLSIQADVIQKEPLFAPEPPSAALSCSDKETSAKEAESLAVYLKAFSAPEGPLCADMLDTQKGLQLLGEYPGYDRETALMERLGRKAQLLINQHGKDLRRLPAVAAATLQTVKAIQLLGSGASGSADALMDSLSAANEAAVEEMFRLLTEEHDYSLVQPLLDAARNSRLLSADSGINTDAFLARLQNALRFELHIVYRIDLPIDHWEETATLQLSPISLENPTHLTGSGTGSMAAYSNDKVPEACYQAPDFSVQAELADFLPCQGTVRLTLSPFYPPQATLILPDEEEPISAEMPLMKTGWELAQEGRLQEGRYVFPLTLRNLDALAVDEAIQTSPTATLATQLEITLTHKPGK